MIEVQNSNKAGNRQSGVGVSNARGPKKILDRETASDSGKPSRSQSNGKSNEKGGVKLPQVSNKNQKPRPSSMHDTPKESGNLRSKPQQRQAPVAKGSAPGKVAPPGGGGPAKAGGVSGFKKLQMGINGNGPAGGASARSNIGGPVVVTYEDEEAQLLKGNQASYRSPAVPVGTGRGNRQSHLLVSKNSKIETNNELKGASEHLYMNGVDVDGISDDQLDRLLVKARNARN